MTSYPDDSFNTSEHFRATAINFLTEEELSDVSSAPKEDKKDNESSHDDNGTHDISSESTKLIDNLSKRNKQQIKPSTRFIQEYELKTLEKVMAIIDETSQRRLREGFHEVNFAVGVLNSLFLPYVFGAFPEHLWLVYVLESLFLIPAKLRKMVKVRPLKETLYYLDFCWVMNFVGVLTLLIVLLERLVTTLDDGRGGEWVLINDYWRRQIYLAIEGVSIGPLLGATGVLPFTALLFHDVSTMAGLFIHILPPVVMYTFMWEKEAIHASWPEMFPWGEVENEEDWNFFPEGGKFSLLVLPGMGLGTVAGNTMLLYTMWFVPYVIWMVLIGLKLPQLKEGDDPNKIRYDTVFATTLRGGLCILMGKVLWKRPASESRTMMKTNNYELRDFVVYMVGHAVAVWVSIYALAFPCFLSKTFHAWSLVVVTILCVYRGSKRYTYYSTVMYGRIIRKEFVHLLEE